MGDPGGPMREPGEERPHEAKGRRRPRRASLPAPVGSDPAPEDPALDPRRDDENDARLREDRPPHWG